VKNQVLYTILEMGMKSLEHHDLIHSSSLVSLFMVISEGLCFIAEVIRVSSLEMNLFVHTLGI